jgi:hypothetical protein
VKAELIVDEEAGSAKDGLWRPAFPAVILAGAAEIAEFYWIGFGWIGGKVRAVGRCVLWGSSEGEALEVGSWVGVREKVSRRAVEAQSFRSWGGCGGGRWLLFAQSRP